MRDRYVRGWSVGWHSGAGRVEVAVAVVGGGIMWCNTLITDSLLEL